MQLGKEQQPGGKKIIPKKTAKEEDNKAGNKSEQKGNSTCQEI